MIIAVADIQKRYPNVSSANVHTTVHLFKKRGKTPEWLLPTTGKKTYIKVKEFERWLTINERAKQYSTDKLYWLFMALGYTDRALSEFMTRKSKYYTCRTSWYGFFKNELFLVFDKQNYRGLYEPTMTTEFVRIGTRYIYNLHKNGKFVIKNEEIFG